MLPNFSRFIKRKNSEQDKAKTEKLNWIIKGLLAVGPIPLSQERIELLEHSDIASVLTLCSEAEGTIPKEIQSKVDWTRVALSDSHSESKMSFLDFSKAVETAHFYIQSSSPLYVHCVAGMERSPSVCVGYLYKYREMELWEALNWVKQANPRTNILDSQLKVIQNLRS